MGDLVVVQYNYNDLVETYEKLLKKWNESTIKRVATNAQRIEVNHRFQHVKILLETMHPWNPYSYDRYEVELIQLCSFIDNLIDMHRNPFSRFNYCSISF